MPILEYLCDNCGKKFERLVRKPHDVTPCPQCGSQQMTLQFSVFGFKGAGDDHDAPKEMGRAGCGCTPSSCACRHA